MKPLKTTLVGATLLTSLLVSTPAAAPQAPGPADDNERQFVEALRREDPSSAERYVALRDARSRAVADLRRVEAQYRAAGAELRSVFLSQLRQAERAYVESSLTLLDFLEARDRRMLGVYQQEIARIKGILEQHERTRAELKKLLQEK